MILKNNGPIGVSIGKPIEFSTLQARRPPVAIKGTLYTLEQLKEIKDIDPLAYQDLKYQAQRELTALNLDITNQSDMFRYQDKLDFAFGDANGELSFSEQLRYKNSTSISQNDELIYNINFVDHANDRSV